jgi:hypothetical protein
VDTERASVTERLSNRIRLVMKIYDEVFEPIFGDVLGDIPDEGFAEKWNRRFVRSIVKGKSRVPKPAASIIAFIIFGDQIRPNLLYGKAGKFAKHVHFKEEEPRTFRSRLFDV